MTERRALDDTIKEGNRNESCLKLEEDEKNCNEKIEFNVEVTLRVSQTKYD